MKRIIVDFDDTLSVTLNRDWDNGLPNQPLIAKLNRLYDEGWEIIILTARGQLSCNGDIVKADNKYRSQIESWLNKNGVKYNQLSFNKLLANYYIDDKGFKPDEFINIIIEPITSGHSGALIYRDNQYVHKDTPLAHNVIKWVNIAKNHINTPKIHSLIGTSIKMDYIQDEGNITIGDIVKIVKQLREIKQYNLSSFDTYLLRIKKHLEYNQMDNKLLHKLKDFEDIYTRERSFCHGDLALDNMLKNNGIIYLIDPIYEEGLWSSWMLDVSKAMHSARKFGNDELYLQLKDSYSDYLEPLYILELSQWARILKYENNEILYNNYKNLLENDLKNL